MEHDREQQPPQPLPAAAQPIDGEILPPKPSRRGRKDLVGRATGRISARLRKAVERVAEGKNITEAAKLTGMHRNALSQALMRPHVSDLLEKLVRVKLATSAGKAVTRIDTLIDGAKSEYVRLEAAKAILDRSGYVGTERASLGGDVVIEIKL